MDYSDGSDKFVSYDALQEDEDINRSSSVSLRDGQGLAFSSPVYEAMLDAEFTGVSHSHALANTKKWMTIVNILTFLLPKDHPLALQIDDRLRLSILGVAKGMSDAKKTTLLQEVVEGKMLKMRQKVTALHTQERFRSSANVSSTSSDGTDWESGDLWASNN